MWTHSAADQNHSAVVRALHSLRDSQANAVEALVSALGAQWSMQRVDTCDGHLMLLLWTDENCENGFALHGEAGGVQLGFNRGDIYEPIGRFDTIDTALQHACRQAGLDAAWTNPPRTSDAAAADWHCHEGLSILRA